MIVLARDSAARSPSFGMKFQMKFAKIFSGYTHASIRPDSSPSNPARVPVTGKIPTAAPRAKARARDLSAAFPASAGSRLRGDADSQDHRGHDGRSQKILAASIRIVLESEELFPAWCAFWRPPLRRVLALPRWPYYKRKRRILA